jgi:hypothetical protein
MTGAEDHEAQIIRGVIEHRDGSTAARAWTSSALASNAAAAASRLKRAVHPGDERALQADDRAPAAVMANDRYTLQAIAYDFPVLQHPFCDYW